MKNITILAFFSLCFIGGLLQVGDFSVVRVLNRILTAGCQTVMFYIFVTIVSFIIGDGESELYN